MKRMKRILAYLLVIATVFALTPTFSNEAYAGNGTEYGLRWVYDSIEGLHNGYAVEGHEVWVDKSNVMSHIRDIHGSDVDASEVSYWFYCDSNGSAEMLAYGDLSYYDTGCYVPADVDVNDRLWLEICYDGYYYNCSDGGYSDKTNWSVICLPSEIDSTNYGITKDKGSKTFTFRGKDTAYGLASSTIDQHALVNTLFILAYNGKVDIEGDTDAEYNYLKVDVNLDGNWDFQLREDPYDEYEGIDDIEVLTDYADSGLYKRVYNLPEGMWIPTEGSHNDYSLVGGGNNGAWPYFNKITFVFPAAIAKSDVTAKSTVVYTGKSISPTVTVKVGGKTLKKGTDYKVSGSRATIGPGTVTVTGMGKYTGTVKKSFSVVPGKVTISSITGGTKQLTVKWGKKSGGVRYQVKYRVKGTSTWSNTTAGTSTSKTIKNLKKGKTYEVKVRAYKTVSGKNYYGAFSTVKTVKVK